MLIKYIGKAAVREISDERGRFVWAGDVDYSQDVPASLAAELLTYPRPEFVPDISDPLCKLPGLHPTLNGEPLAFGVPGMDALIASQREAVAKLAGLALAGVGTIGDLAGMSKKALAEAAEESGISLETLTAWQEAVKKAGE